MSTDSQKKKSKSKKKGIKQIFRKLKKLGPKKKVVEPVVVPKEKMIEKLKEDDSTNGSGSSSSNSSLSSISAPDDFDVLGLESDLNLSTLDLIPDNYYMAFSQRKRQSNLPKRNAKESGKVDKEVMEMNQLVQRRLVDDLLKKRGKKLKKKEEKKRRKLMKKMKKKIHKAMKEKHDREEQLENYKKNREVFLRSAAVIWRKEIIPEFSKRKLERRTIKLWKKGLPPNIRGKIWALAIGNDAVISKDLFEILKKQPLEDKIAKLEETMELIELDLRRTFPQLQFFQKGGPQNESFRTVLECWVKYRPDVGYVQGMSYLVAMLLLNMGEFESFQALANILTSRKYHFFSLFSIDRYEIDRVKHTLFYLLKEKMSELHEHFLIEKINTEVFVIDWFITLFSKSFPLDISCHLWDQYFCPCDAFGGEIFLYRATLGILLYYFPRLVRCGFDGVMAFLSHISREVTEKDKLEMLKAISLIKLSGKQLNRAKKAADKLVEKEKKKTR